MRWVVSDHGKPSPIPGSAFVFRINTNGAFSFFLAAAHDSLAKIYIPCALPALERGPGKSIRLRTEGVERSLPLPGA